MYFFCLQVARETNGEAFDRRGRGLMSGSRYQTSPSRKEGSPLLYTTNTVHGLQISSPNKHSLQTVISIEYHDKKYHLRPYVKVNKLHGYVIRAEFKRSSSKVFTLGQPSHLNIVCRQ